MKAAARERAGLILTIVLTVVVAFNLWMRAGFPVYGIRGSYADDHLFLKLAQYIGEGRWLGPFDDLTLVKGPAYPVFIAVAALLHVPLKLAEQACLVAASAALCLWISRRDSAGQRPVASLALGCTLFVLLCFDPIIWTASLARVIREGLYMSLSLALVACALRASFPDPLARIGGSVRSGAGLGLIGSAFWLTREEGVWLLPSVAVVVVVAAVGEFARWRTDRRTGTPRTAEPLLWRQAASFATAALVSAGVLVAVAAINLRTYGVFELNEVKSSAFTHAYGALSRVEPDQWQRYIVFPKAARDQAYAVSPAARELSPVLDGASGQNVAAVHCAEYAITPCTGFHAGWFQWTLREAVRGAGHYGSASEALAFYRRLAREIDDACDAHRIRCLPARNALAPPFRWEYLGDALHEAWPMFTLFATLGGTQIGRVPSSAIGGDLDAIADLVGTVQPPVSRTTFIHGWVATPGDAPSLSVIPRHDDPLFTLSVDLQPQGDVELRYPGLHAVEFTINTVCPHADCDVVLSTPGQADIRLPIASLRKDTMPLDGVSKMLVDKVEEDPAFPFGTMVQRMQLRLARVLAVPYRAAHVLWPFALASLALAVGLDFRRPKPLGMYALALASLTAVLSRITLLSYLEVTSIPSLNLLYLSPAMPLFIVFIVTAFFLGGQATVRTVRERGRWPAFTNPRRTSLVAPRRSAGRG